MKFTVIKFDSLASTNTEAAEHARRGAVEGLCIVADEQTAGRGRQGREWRSGKGSGVYMSLLLRPRLDMKHLPLLSLMAAVAVHDVLLEDLHIDADIKWPNDVLVGEKKICGILSEIVETSHGTAVVLGIGINLTSQGLPDIATSISAESAVSGTRDALVDAVNGKIGPLYELAHTRPSAILDAWRDRSSYFEGKMVSVSTGDGSFTGITCGLEANGALRIRTSDGGVKAVQAGDVERLRTAEIEVAA